MQTLEGVRRYYWYECSCGLVEGKRKHITKRSHARAYWNTQNALVASVNKLCNLLEKKDDH